MAKIVKNSPKNDNVSNVVNSAIADAVNAPITAAVAENAPLTVATIPTYTVHHERIPIDQLTLNPSNRRVHGKATVGGVNYRDGLDTLAAGNLVTRSGWTQDLTVSRRADGTNIVLKGNRRTAGVKDAIANPDRYEWAVGAETIVNVPCQVYTGLTAEQEVDLARDHDSKPLYVSEVLQDFWKLLAAGNKGRTAATVIAADLAACSVLTRKTRAALNNALAETDPAKRNNAVKKAVASIIDNLWIPASHLPIHYRQLMVDYYDADERGASAGLSEDRVKMFGVLNPCTPSTVKAVQDAVKLDGDNQCHDPIKGGPNYHAKLAELARANTPNPAWQGDKVTPTNYEKEAQSYKTDLAKIALGKAAGKVQAVGERTLEDLDREYATIQDFLSLVRNATPDCYDDPSWCRMVVTAIRDGSMVMK